MEEAGNSSLSQSPAVYAPLLRAILEDDWKTAEAFIQNNPNCYKVAITKDQRTALHFAAAAKRTRFVKELVKRMTEKELELKTNGNCTALYFAAQSEIVTIAEEMVNKNKNLPLIFPKDHFEFLPFYAAIKTGNRDMVSYLYYMTPIENLDFPVVIELFKATISSDLYDMAHKILEYLKPAHGERELLWEPLVMLAKKPSEIGSKSEPSVWERCLNSCFSRFCNKALMQASAHKLVDRLLKELGDDIYVSPTADNQHTMKVLVHEATKVGNVEFLIILIRSYPELLTWKVDEKYGTLFHVAIIYRQERVFNLIYEIGGLKDNLAISLSRGGNNLLHLAGQLPPSNQPNIVASGQEALLSMQRELWWFQEIEKIVPKSFVNQLNERKETPRNTYVKNHKKLHEKGEKWMKDKAKSCMLVATLIVTLVFPAAFTVPGGNNQETGIPIFLECNWFTVFFISDTIAMVFSSSSMLVFLAIFYSEKDYFESLPNMMVLGVVMLSISIVGMLTAFITACFLVFKLNTIASIGLIGGTCLIVYRPFRFYVKLYYELLLRILHSLHYSLGFRFRSHNRLFKACKLTRERMTCRS